MYGYGSSLKDGNHFMAHKCGFTDKVLFNELKRVGFKIISVIKATRCLCFMGNGFQKYNISRSPSRYFIITSSLF